MKNEEVKEKLEELLIESNHKFNLWELDFLNNMENCDGDYSENQAAKIEQIYKKVIEGQ